MTEQELFKELLKGNYLSWDTLDKNMQDTMCDELEWYRPFMEICRVKSVRRQGSWKHVIRRLPKFDYYFEGGELWKKDIRLALKNLGRL